MAMFNSFLYVYQGVITCFSLLVASFTHILAAKQTHSWLQIIGSVGLGTGLSCFWAHLGPWLQAADPNTRGNV
jgi:hypothetical protein